MHITQDDAALIYARVCLAWYGRRALRVVADKVNELKRRGDTSGVAAWSKVAAALAHPAPRVDLCHKQVSAFKQPFDGERRRFAQLPGA